MTMRYCISHGFAYEEEVYDLVTISIFLEAVIVVYYPGI